MASDSVKLIKALETLGKAIDHINAIDDGEKDLAFLSVAKAFEVAVEYAWRSLREMVEDEGLDAPSPKAAVREAARLGIIDNPESWIEYINARNAGVHDYFGMTNEEYVKIAKEFLLNVKKLWKRK